MKIEELEQRAFEALEIAKMGKFPTMALLLEARFLVQGFTRSPGITREQCEEFIHKVDKHCFGDWVQ